MNFKKYILDKKYLILFYIILMTFISLVIYLDITVKVSINNILYINFVSIVLLLFYLIGEYLVYKRYYEDINYILKNRKEDIINCLPNPNNYVHSLYNELLINIYNQQNEKIDKLHEEKKENLEFMTSWVHEIKTPISVSRLIIENSMSKSKEEILDSLEEEIDKIENYVEQALYYSRLDDFSKDYLINEINIEKVVKEVIKKHAKTFINKRIKINIEDINMSVNTDKKWLIFIINQIIDNSLKYTSEDGYIKINIEKDGKEKRLVIEDNGIGIKKEDISRIFDRGFTGYNGRKSYKSTGMGLYLSKRLAIKLGHDITVESKFKEYTKVIIHFPKLIDYFTVTKS
ncbi:sensor histidine kinase [Crassaminicella indica]|uniref:histidine kinase n=1 Tax=Crassaminicella indica TaxID=2855394 RepID=A0ABX8RC28_9CLOT|nr:sensor histidine kinase [Crassaminicella indica]QXM05480.1 sensor histidine kinase [Crassaminicella indica]